MTDHQWSELTAPYALGVLDPQERTGFEAHLAECAACRSEVQSFRDVAVLLADSAPPAAPAPALRERILREARQVRPIASPRSPLVLWVAAAASVALALLAGNAYRTERAARRELEQAVARTRDSLAAEQQLVQILLAPDVNTAVLTAKGRPPAARLFWNPSRRRVVIAVFDLPPAPAGRIYQLWAIAAGKPVSLGVFNTRPDGRVTAAMDVPPDLAAFQVTAVTEEPAGGSPQPTQQPFLIGKLSGGE